ncbi:flagellar hook-length control protein FliK [Paracoccus aurantiacus]|nr:flagellar hook-length control protein FliK [Paracoccus aurantiacus]
MRITKFLSAAPVQSSPGPGTGKGGDDFIAMLLSLGDSRKAVRNVAPDDVETGAADQPEPAANVPKDDRTQSEHIDEAADDASAEAEPGSEAIGCVQMPIGDAPANPLRNGALFTQVETAQVENDDPRQASAAWEISPTQPTGTGQRPLRDDAQTEQPAAEVVERDHIAESIPESDSSGNPPPLHVEGVKLDALSVDPDPIAAQERPRVPPAGSPHGTRPVEAIGNDARAKPDQQENAPAVSPGSTVTIGANPERGVSPATIVHAQAASTVIRRNAAVDIPLRSIGTPIDLTSFSFAKGPPGLRDPDIVNAIEGSHDATVQARAVHRVSPALARQPTAPVVSSAAAQGVQTPPMDKVSSAEVPPAQDAPGRTRRPTDFPMQISPPKQQPVPERVEDVSENTVRVAKSDGEVTNIRAPLRENATPPSDWPGEGPDLGVRAIEGVGAETWRIEQPSEMQRVSHIGSPAQIDAPVVGQTSSTPQPVVTSPTDPARQVAEAIVLAEPGSAETELTLAPDELGKVRFAIIHTDTGISISITAERADTLALLRRHAEILAAELLQSGLAGASIEFGTSDQRRGERKGFGKEAHRSATDTNYAPAVAVRPSVPRGSGRLDLRL